MKLRLRNILAIRKDRCFVIEKIVLNFCVHGYFICRGTSGILIIKPDSNDTQKQFKNNARLKSHQDVDILLI